jgi:hypothetical protein
VTPLMVLAANMVEEERDEGQGHRKPIVASLAGDIEVERPPIISTRTASAYAYSTEIRSRARRQIQGARRARFKKPR